MPQKKLILVGAGPGDPELISLKGIKALQQANVVMYDALVSEELLQHAPNAIKLFCGKRAGTHYMKQDEINQKIVEQANLHGVVVRLKGGDPFILVADKKKWNMQNYMAFRLKYSRNFECHRISYLASNSTDKTRHYRKRMDYHRHHFLR
jgi:siroheme synthase